MTGVGVYSSRCASMTSTPLAASTSSALAQRRNRQRVRVDAEEERPVDPPALAVIANGLADGEDMPFVEGALESAAAVPGGAEGNALRRHGRIRHDRVVGRDEPGHVDQHRRRGRLAGEGIRVHGCLAFVAAAAFEAMLPIRSCHDRAKAAVPSRWSSAESASWSTPSRANSASTDSASPPSIGIGSFTCPCSAKACSVFSGMVLMVSGAASAST